MGRNEPVRVAVVFEPGRRPRPVWFERQRQKHVVKEVTYCWQDHVGDKPLVHFTVTDGEALFELTYSPLEGNWMLAARQAVA